MEVNLIVWINSKLSYSVLSKNQQVRLKDRPLVFKPLWLSLHMKVSRVNWIWWIFRKLMKIASNSICHLDWEMDANDIEYIVMILCYRYKIFKRSIHESTEDKIHLEFPIFRQICAMNRISNSIRTIFSSKCLRL